MGVEGLEVGVEVDLLVGGVDDAVETDPHPLIGAVGDHVDGDRPLGEARERDAGPVVARHGGGRRPPVDHDLAEAARLPHGEVEERLGSGRRHENPTRVVLRKVGVEGSSLSSSSTR